MSTSQFAEPAVTTLLTEADNLTSCSSYMEALGKLNDALIMLRLLQKQDQMCAVLLQMATIYHHNLENEKRALFLYKYHRELEMRLKRAPLSAEVAARMVELKDLGVSDMCKEGFVQKQGHLIKNWKTRHMRLDSLYIAYYKTDKEHDKPINNLCLLGATTCVYSPMIKCAFVIRWQNNYELHCKVAVQSDCDQWVDCINAVIAQIVNPCKK